MENAQPGHTVEFQGLQGAAHLNGTHGTLIQFHRSGEARGRWAVRCQIDNNRVNAKPENLKLVRTERQANPRQRRGMRGGGGGRDMSAFTGEGPAPPADAWLQGLSAADKYEWFSNCYQMRCDDDYQWGGCDLHGPYEPDSSPESIARDFMTFCLLAKRRNVVPNDWDWSAFLQAAAQNVGLAFEKSDARERWGSENYFDALMGGRSLRYTAEQVYDSKVDVPERSRVHLATDDEVSNDMLTAQNEIGGTAAWARFVADLAAGTRFRT